MHYFCQNSASHWKHTFNSLTNLDRGSLRENMCSLQSQIMRRAATPSHLGDPQTQQCTRKMSKQRIQQKATQTCHVSPIRCTMSESWSYEQRHPAMQFPEEPSKTRSSRATPKAEDLRWTMYNPSRAARVILCWAGFERDSRHSGNPNPLFN